MTEIAFKIEGRKDRDGYETIVSYGKFPSREPSQYDGGTLIQEDRIVYILKQNNEYSLYGLIDKNTWAHNSNSYGHLIVVVIIPAKMDLKKHRSPYLLLRAIYNKFIKEYMTESEYLPAGVHRFKDVPSPDTSVFQEIIDEYTPLVKSEVTDPIYMGDAENYPTGKLRRKEEEMEKFFSNPQHFVLEFDHYSSIEISENCISNVKINSQEVIYEKPTIKYSKGTTQIQQTIIDSLIEKSDIKLYVDGNDLTKKLPTKKIKDIKGKTVVVTPDEIDNHYVLTAEQFIDDSTNQFVVTISVATKQQGIDSPNEDQEKIVSQYKQQIETLKQENNRYKEQLSKPIKKSKVWKLASACVSLLLIISGIIIWMLSQRKTEDNNSAFISIINKDIYRTSNLKRIITYEEVKNAANLCFGIEKTEIIDKIFSSDKDGSGKSNLPDSVLEMRQPFSWERLYAAIKETTNIVTKPQTTDDYQRYIEDNYGSRSLVYINNGMWNECKNIYADKNKDNCTPHRINQLKALFNRRDLEDIKTKVKEYIDSTHSWIKTWGEFDEVVGALNQQTNVTQNTPQQAQNQSQFVTMLQLYDQTTSTLMSNDQRNQSLENIMARPEYENLNEEQKNAIKKVYTCKSVKLGTNPPKTFKSLEDFMAFANTITE